MRRTAALVSVCILVVAASCTSSPPPPVVPCDSTAMPAGFESRSAADVGVYVESSDPMLAPVRADIVHYLGAMWGTTPPSSSAAPDGSKGLSVWISSSPAAAAALGTTIDEGYAFGRLDAGGKTTLLVYSKTPGDLASGAYALLEELGCRFFHPKQELVPHFAAAFVPTTLRAWRRPAASRRGMQPHTLHPIEYFATFMEPGDANLADAKAFIDWLVKTGQNYVQWPLLSTVDWNGWKPYVTSILAYAHGRGVRVGASVEVWGGSALQNNYVLVGSTTNWQSDWQSQMDAGLAKLLEIPWDVVDLTLGEFVATDPQAVIDSLNHATEYVLAHSPSTQVNVENHVGNYPQLWVKYQGQTIYYYHLPQYCDARLGQSVHTLSLFDLYRDWGTYAHPNFWLQHDYMLQEIPSRRVSYFPESAYWISADIDVPLFLPEEIFARWIDIHNLTSELANRGLPGLEGHTEFMTGHEWGYWLTDYLVAKMLWEPSDPFEYFLSRYTSAFGSCGGDVQLELSQYVALQTKYLFDQRLLAYVQGENGTVDLGYLAGLETHPKRIEFEQLLTMTEAERSSFESTVLAGLDAFASQSQTIEDAIAARCRGSDATIAPWCDELRDGVSIGRLRAQHAALLYRAILSYVHGDGGGAHSQLSQASAITDQAAHVIAGRETQYRFDVQRVTAQYSNPTVYDFGYLREAHTQCYWHRREDQVAFILQNGGPESLATLRTCAN
ncbi:MAG TPA: hypothetical protein VF765_28990 [Polyangiaceae bacterium]